MRTRLVWTLLALGCVLTPACADDDPKKVPADEPDAGVGACARFVKALTECAVLTGTRFKGCADDDPQLACALSCVERATCAQIAGAYCDNVLNSYAGCLNECDMAAPPPQFVCADGETVAASWRCDGTPDCPDGSDEDCPSGTFSCRDGLTLPAGWQCDGNVDCAGGDDEGDCGPQVPCDDGTTISASRECDGTDDCAQGEDELDCTHLACG